METRQQLILLDIDGTQVNSPLSVERDEVVWFGGGPEIWRVCINILKAEGIAAGLATFKWKSDFISREVERQLADCLHPQHRYYDYDSTIDKNVFALEVAAGFFKNRADVGVLDDQEEVIKRARDGGFAAVQIYDFAANLNVPNLELRQQLAIVSAFEQIVENFGRKPIAALTHLKREIAILLAAAENNSEALTEILEEKGVEPQLNICMNGLNALELARSQGFDNCERLLRHYEKAPQPPVLNPFPSFPLKRVSSLKFFDDSDNKELKLSSDSKTTYQAVQRASSQNTRRGHSSFHPYPVLIDPTHRKESSHTHRNKPNTKS